MTHAVIAGYARSPFTLATKGALARTRPDDLAAQVVRGLIAQTGVKPEDIEDIIMGCAFPEAEQGFNIGRLVALLADLPISVAGMTVNRFCGSSMQSIHIAAGQIALGAGDAFICAGIESMSRVPMMGFNPLPNPELGKKSAGAYMGMGETAENVARKWQIPRAEQEAFAVRSQQKAAAAQKDGRLAAEIVAITGRGGTVDQDGCIRPETTAEALAGLKPAFAQDGTVTAGTSSPLTDGAAAVLVTSEAYAEKHGLTPIARIKAVSVAGCAPEIMGIGPVAATRRALARAGLEAKDIDVVEINEAFASQAIACLRELGLPEERVNLDGGAIALGHPLGATGARITGKAASVLKREGGRYALSTQCIGGGQGIATILERV
ncbi:thiolase family protein [Acidisphaera rubrifaciens]|uniref:Acetyl-CoA acetyltransferase n=1 Tax=Acidisphaera rubrifaciens HS-AP3 TaxID=1231350 RepID=A0A0D6P7T5_9PROT|nr:thiolase family protein [Acidisphaera rubrifaciens]GAN77830.1 acetyl-CoA acetyltransferase [Acidisphaera rubrifaciens HS-AP3]